MSACAAVIHIADRYEISSIRNSRAAATCLRSSAARSVARLTAGLVHIIDDDERAVESLLAVAGGPMFEHRAAQLRQDRVSAQARAEAAAAYAERGFTILDERPQWRDTSAVLLRHLRTPDGREATVAEVTDPTQWAVLMVEEVQLVDADTGDPVDDDDVDWSTEHHPEHDPRRPPARRQRGRKDRVAARVLLPGYQRVWTNPRGSS